MDVQHLTAQVWISATQLVVGVIVLVTMTAVLQISGRMRRALDFPPAPRNTLTGSHLLFVLIAFLLTMQMLLYAAGRLGYTVPTAPQPAATEPASEAQESSEHPAFASPAALPAPTDPDASPAPEAQNDPVSLLMLGVAELLAVGLMLYVASITFDGGLQGFGLRTDRLHRDLTWAVVGYLAFWPACFVLAELTTLLYKWLISKPPPEHEVLLFLEAPDVSLLWQLIAWTLAGVVAPIFEELFFRGLLLNWLRNATRSTTLAIILSGVAFGIIHKPQWHLVPALTALGIILGYAYTRTNSLTLPILFHAVFNMRTLVMLEVARSQS